MKVIHIPQMYVTSDISRDIAEKVWKFQYSIAKFLVEYNNSAPNPYIIIDEELAVPYNMFHPEFENDCAIVKRVYSLTAFLRALTI